jgi:hypothetical protein
LSSFVVEDAYAPNNVFHPAQALTLAPYDHHLLLDFRYTRPSRSFSATIQFYARSSQLDTARVRYRRVRDTLPWCHFDRYAFENTYHIFALCPVFSTIRCVHNVQLCGETFSLLEGRTTDHIRRVSIGPHCACFLTRQGCGHNMLLCGCITPSRML